MRVLSLYMGGGWKELNDLIYHFSGKANGDELSASQLYMFAI